jgi:hypothetical protein
LVRRRDKTWGVASPWRGNAVRRELASFVVDNSEAEWKAIRYPKEWSDIASQFSMATGMFEIGGLLSLDDKRQQLEKLRVLMGGELTGRTRGQSTRLTTNEAHKAGHLGDSYWLYVACDSLERPDREPVPIQNPGKHLDHAKREVVAPR